MLFSLVPELSKRLTSDLLLFPFWEREKKPKAAFSLPKSLPKEFSYPIDSQDFNGKEAEIVFLYGDFEKEKRAALFGLGKEEGFSQESVRKAFGSIIRAAHKKKYRNLSIVLPNIVELKGLSLEQFLGAVCEGILSANYKYEEKNQSDFTPVSQVTLIGVIPAMGALVQRFETLFEGVYFARDLINGNADIITPSYLAKSAQKLQKDFPKLKVTLFDKKRIEREKMGLLLAVARGSPHDPVFIILEYRGNPRSKEHTVLVGKGITFDTGGLNLKPTGSMETMRDDMAGAATVMSTLANVAALELKVNATAVIASCENAIDGASFKPGDVYKSYLGKTVEIGNTDAEGRLILADALAYAVKNLRPTRIIDLATLTGAVSIALGHDIAGLFSNEEALCKSLEESGLNTAELLWRLPLHPAYKELLKSDIADIKNVGGRAGGSILGALFLQEFVGATPWAHIDIGSTAFQAKEGVYLPKNALGFGVRLLTDFFSYTDK